MNASSIAQTILNQLGGSKIKVMIGMYNETYDEKGSLSFKFKAKSKNGVNYCQIKWNRIPDDYTMIFGKIRNLDYKEMDRIEGLYAEELKRVFEEETGLATNL